MINISISDKLKEKCPEVAIACIKAKVKVSNSNEELWKEINDESKKIINKLELKDVLEVENIKASRKAYKMLGKDPSKYRLSSESLIRRLVKGLDLYKVNNIVDINNLISLRTANSVGTYDIDNIGASISFTVGDIGESYEGIGRGSINLENLPVFEDEKGKFGSTTSDSKRAMITEDTNYILMNIISFNGSENLDTYIKDAVNLLEKYASGEKIEYKIIQ